MKTNYLNRVVAAGVILVFALVLLPSVATAQQSGGEVWGESCGNCHVIQPARRYSADQWGRLVTHMTITARLTDEQSAAVLQYLRRGAREVASTAAPRADERVLLASNEPASVWEYLQESAPNGSVLYREYCRSCHGSRGKGNGRAGRTMDPRPDDISDPEYLSTVTDEEMAKIIIEGKNEMDRMEDGVTEADVAAIIAWVRHLGELRQQ